MPTQDKCERLPIIALLDIQAGSEWWTRKETYHDHNQKNRVTPCKQYIPDRKRYTRHGCITLANKGKVSGF